MVALSKLKVVFVVGQTASGKSQLALSLAEACGGAIINCDSIQLFKSLDIGSAKPTAEDFKRVPHYLFDYVDEGQDITAGTYARDFFALLEKVENQYPIVFVVGGTGFYFQAVEKGMYPIGAANPLRLAEVEAEIIQDAQRVYQELVMVDPETAQKISPQDHYRLARAVEIIRSHGRSVSAIKKEFEAKRPPFPYPLLKLGIRLERELLLERVRQRTAAMLKAGLIDEVRTLLSRDLGAWSALQSVGYRECLDYLAGTIPTEAQLFELIVQNTMRLAKKQRTWFQRDGEILWFSSEDSLGPRQQLERWLVSTSVSTLG